MRGGWGGGWGGHELSQPGMPQTNGIAERAVQEVLAGTRTLLVQAGLPGYFWGYASQCYCLLHNTRAFPHVHVGLTDRHGPLADDGAMHSAGFPAVGGEQLENAWSRRHHKEFHGQRIPFGCGVFFKPAVTKYHLDKANARACYGVFLGYRLAPGCRWNGEYLVADLSDFVHLDLSETAPRHGVTIYEHVTKVVRLPKEGVVFPLKNRYDFLNTTLGGLRHAAGEGTELPELFVGLDPIDLGPEAEVSGGDPATSADEGSRPGSSTDPAPALPPLPVPPEDLALGPGESWVLDKRGRRYKVDEYGIRIVPGSKRPEGVLPSDWNKRVVNKDEQQ